MKLLLVRHLWGVDLTHGLAPHLGRWRELGYGALEVSPRLVPDVTELKATLQKEGWRWIPQIFSNFFVPGGSVQSHLQTLQEQIEECLDDNPLLFNGHTASDTWTAAEAEDFYGQALEMERRLGVVLCHETHRGRYFGNPWATAALLKRFPTLKLTCDFSHWVCVAERLLEDCLPIIQSAAAQCRHLHARIGYEQGPQVPDPRAPEYARHLAAHEGWWGLI